MERIPAPAGQCASADFTAITRALWGSLPRGPCPGDRDARDFVVRVPLDQA